MNKKIFKKIIKEKFNNRDVERIMLAYQLAKYGHRGQTRSGGKRYFEHPRQVALIIIQELKIFDPSPIITALLHDLEEDSSILTNGNIKHIFGEQISKPMSCLTKRKNITKEKYLKQIGRTNKKTRLVKLADRLDNLRDMKNWSRDKKISYALQTQKYILPWAERTSKKLAREIKFICDQLLFYN